MNLHLRKKRLIVLLSGCLIGAMLAGCNKSSTEQTSSNAKNTSMGRYIEQAVPCEALEAGGQPFLLQNQKGSLQLYIQTGEELLAYEEQSDLSWQSITPSWLATFNEKYNKVWITDMALDENDNPYFSTVRLQTSEGFMSGDEQIEEISKNPHLMSTEGRTTIIHLEGNQWKESILKIDGMLPYISILQLLVNSKGDLFVSTEFQGQQRLSLKTNSGIKVYSSDDSRMALMDQKLYTINLRQNQIDVYDLSNNSIEKSIPCGSVMDKTSQLLTDEKHNLILITKQGIERLAPGGSIWEKLLDGKGVTLSRPTYTMLAAAQKEDRLMVLMRNGVGGLFLKQYSYSDSTPTLPNAELTLYSLEDNKTLEECMAAYQVAHPEVRLTLQVGFSQEGGKTRRDAINALNTEFLAGKGPDIIILDGLPIQNYMKQGILASLQAIDGKDAIPSYMLQPFTKDNNTYALPLRFTVPTLWGNKEFISTHQDMLSLAQYKKENPHTLVLPLQSPSHLVPRLMAAYEDQWFNERGEVQEQPLRDFIEMIKTFSCDEQQDLYFDHCNTPGMYTFIDTSSLFEVTKGTTLAYEDNMTHVMDVLLSSIGSNQKAPAAFQLLAPEGEPYCELNTLIGVNHNSARQDLAMSFTTEMLSKENQLIPSGQGFPTCQEIFDYCIAGENGPFQYYAITTVDGSGTTQITIEPNVFKKDPKTAAEVAAFGKAVNAISKVKIADSTLTEIVLEESKPYINGEKTLDEVMQSLKDKLTLYKQEY